MSKLRLLRELFEDDLTIVIAYLFRNIRNNWKRFQEMKLSRSLLIDSVENAIEFYIKDLSSITLISEPRNYSIKTTSVDWIIVPLNLALVGVSIEKARGGGHRPPLCPVREKTVAHAQPGRAFFYWNSHESQHITYILKLQKRVSIPPQSVIP